MSDPERLFKSASADPAVRDLVASLREVAPGQNAGLAAWSAMAAKVITLPQVVPPPAPASISAANGVALGAMGAAGGQVAAVVALAALLGAGGYWYRAQQRAPLLVASAPSVPVLAAALAVVAPSAPFEAPAQQISSAPSISSAPALSSTPRSRLDAEASLVATARRELRGGKPRAALATLRLLQTQFPRAELGPERDVLMVEALSASGNTAAAKSKASAFIAAHPSSPLSAKLERLVDAP